MSQITRKWIESEAINNSKMDSSDAFTMTGLTLRDEDAFLTLKDSAENIRWVIKRDSTDSALKIHSNSQGNNFQVQNAVSSVPSLIVDTQTSKVGINTTAPVTAFDVISTGNSASFKNPAGPSYVDIDSGVGKNYRLRSNVDKSFDIYDASTLTSRLSISDTGDVNIHGGNISNLTNLGIGTTSPVDRIQVEGGASSANIRITTNITGHTAVDGFAFGVDQATGNALISNGETTPIVFYTNAAEVMRLTASGRLGIGTTDPQDSLQVSGNILGTDSSSNLGSPTHRFANLYMASNIDSTNDLTISMPAGEKMRLTTDGNFGIGTTDPVAKLDVVGGFSVRSTAGNPTRDQVSYYASGTGAKLIITDNDSSVQIQLNSGGVSYLNGGNVGIGTTDPTTNLHVQTGTTNGQGIHLYSGSEKVVSLNYEENSGTGGRIQIHKGGATYIDLDSRRSTIRSNSGTIYPLMIKSDSNANMIGFYQQGTGNGQIDMWDDAGNKDIRFVTEAGKASYINNGGNVGIGTTDPSTKLQIGSGNDIFQADRGYVQIKKVGVGSPGQLDIGGQDYSGSTVEARINFQIQGQTRARIEMFQDDFTQKGDLRFHTATGGSLSERMRIAHNGNVGIGTTDPSTKLQIGSGSDIFQADRGYVQINKVGVGSPGQLDIGGQDYSGSTVEARINFQIQGQTRARIEMFQDDFTQKGDLRFHTATGGSLSERMRIAHNGNVGINCSPGKLLQVEGTNPAVIRASYNGTYFTDIANISHGSGSAIYGSGHGMLFVGRNEVNGEKQGEFRWMAGNTTISTINISAHQNNGEITNSSKATMGYDVWITSDGNANARGTFTSDSDARLKKDVVTIENALEKITSIRGVHYTWNELHGPSDPGVQTGVIAQEVQEAGLIGIIPPLENEDDYLGASYDKLTAYLIEAVKELNNEVIELKKRIK